ncbi:hypothetical protein SO802_006736 [Lithocarpus litseifolius]|uniref:Uncharacterized protein n=1 Tax=Lithocarpus litseifolius TaxID=425828 RepID=A0AAW2DLV3_9ROSI
MAGDRRGGSVMREGWAEIWVDRCLWDLGVWLAHDLGGRLNMGVIHLKGSGSDRRRRSRSEWVASDRRWPCVVVGRRWPSVVVASRGLPWVEGIKVVLFAGCFLVLLVNLNHWKYEIEKYLLHFVVTASEVRRTGGDHEFMGLRVEEDHHPSSVAGSQSTIVLTQTSVAGSSEVGRYGKEMELLLEEKLKIELEKDEAVSEKPTFKHIPKVHD